MQSVRHAERSHQSYGRVIELFTAVCLKSSAIPYYPLYILCHQSHIRADHACVKSDRFSRDRQISSFPLTAFFWFLSVFGLWCVALFQCCVCCRSLSRFRFGLHTSTVSPSVLLYSTTIMQLVHIRRNWCIFMFSRAEEYAEQKSREIIIRCVRPGLHCCGRCVTTLIYSVLDYC